MFSRLTAISITFIALAVPSVRAQVLATGETGGKGSHAVMISGNAISPKDYTTISNGWVQYAYGAADRVDVFASYGVLTAFGTSQHYAGLGSNINVIKRDWAGFDASVFTNANIPFNRRDESCPVLANIAVIGSRPLALGRLPITVYGGFSTLAPLGDRRDKVFTPGEVVHSGIVGFAIPAGKRLIFFIEFNPGPLQRSAGAGALYIFPRGQ